MFSSCPLTCLVLEILVLGFYNINMVHVKRPLTSRTVYRGMIGRQVVLKACGFGSIVRTILTFDSRAENPRG